MNYRKIITLHGPTCSGKSVAARHLTSLGWRWIEASDILKTLLEAESLENTLTCKKEFFLKHGRDAVARRIRTMLLESEFENEQICISGFRMIEEVDCLKGVAEVYPIYIEASTEARFTRSKERQRQDCATTISQFRENSEWEFNLGLNEMRSHCKIVIPNSGALTEFLTELEAAIP